MTVLPILIAPDPRLKTKARPVGTVDAAIRRLMDDLLETMYLAPGVGLAAPQVGIPKRIITVDTARDGEARKPYRMADPEVVWASEEETTYNEGCLSLPEYYADVTRPSRVRVRYRDETDTVREIEADGLLATCLQHEIDHLNGILFVDYLSPLKRNIILRKLAKTKKTQSEKAQADKALDDRAQRAKGRGDAQAGRSGNGTAAGDRSPQPPAHPSTPQEAKPVAAERVVEADS